jgi:hypothetical protein
MSEFVWADPPGQRAFPIAKAGYPLVAAGAFVTAVFALLGLTAPALIGMFATACVCAFFRDPDRAIPTEPGAVVSPADGKVIVVETVDDCPFLEGPRLKVSVFMTVFNVHVNRVPVSGTIRSDLPRRHRPPGRQARHPEKRASCCGCASSWTSTSTCARSSSTPAWRPRSRTRGRRTSTSSWSGRTPRACMPARAGSCARARPTRWPSRR